MLGLDYTVTGDRFDQKKLKESWLWPNQRLIKNKLLKARNLNDNSERLVDSSTFNVIRFLALKYSIFVKGSVQHIPVIKQDKQKEKKSKNKHGREHLRSIKVNLIVSIFQPTA